MQIREFRVGDESALHAVFHSSIHLLACADYTPEQIDAWAPEKMDQVMWAKRMREIKPFVLELQGQVVAYADVQANGYIDHFFVSGMHSRRGIGTLLMAHLHFVARNLGIAELTSDVSRTAQPFFERCGFEVVELKFPVRRGVLIPNALMRKVMADDKTGRCR